MKIYFLPVLALLFLGTRSHAAPSPAAKASPSLDPQVEALLVTATKFYTGLQSFEVDVTSTTKVEMPTMKTEMGSSFHIAVSRPNSFSIEMKAGMNGGSLISDGKTMITYEQMFNKYTSVPAPDPKQLFQPMNLVMVEGGLPLGIEPLLGPDGMTDFKAGLKKSEYLGNEKIGDVATHHVRLTTSVYVEDLWIADGAQPLLLQSRISPDFTRVMKNIPAAQKKMMPAGLGTMKMERTTQFIHWQLNQPIVASTFQFQPPLGAQLVDEFFPRPHSPLEGKLAPDFQLSDLDGKTVKLADLRGKPVVLDFWATWCGPCEASLPLVLGTTAAFKKDGVAFYSVNLKENPDAIRKFQSSKNLAFPVLLDRDGKVSDLYLAKAIPETVVIDKDGKIAAVHVGYDPGIQKKLTQQLNDLIKGPTPAAAPGTAVPPAGT